MDEVEHTSIVLDISLYSHEGYFRTVITYGLPKLVYRSCETSIPSIHLVLALPDSCLSGQSMNNTKT